MKHPLLALVLGCLAIIAVVSIAIHIKLDAQGMDGLYWSRFSAGYLICAVPVFLLALAGAFMVMHSPADKFSRKDKKK